MLAEQQFLKYSQQPCCNVIGYFAICVVTSGLIDVTQEVADECILYNVLEQDTASSSNRSILLSNSKTIKDKGTKRKSGARINKKHNGSCDKVIYPQ